jgi:hypothetical protein
MRSKAGMDRGLLAFWGEELGSPVDTLVDPVETLSSSHMRAAARAAGVNSGGDGPRPTLPSIDPEAQVQWFSRVLDDEPVSTVDLEILWDEDGDAEPTLVLRRRAQS